MSCEAVCDISPDSPLGVCHVFKVQTSTMYERALWRTQLEDARAGGDERDACNLVKRDRLVEERHAHQREDGDDRRRPDGVGERDLKGAEGEVEAEKGAGCRVGAREGVSRVGGERGPWLAIWGAVEGTRRLFGRGRAKIP